MKKSDGVRSGLLGGQVICPLLPVHRLGKPASGIQSMSNLMEWGPVLLVNLKVWESKQFLYAKINLSLNGIFCKIEKTYHTGIQKSTARVHFWGIMQVLKFFIWPFCSQDLIAMTSNMVNDVK
jgi:hypothetical protein